MPVKNELIGGYHCVQVAGKFVLCDKVTRTHRMTAKAKALMQGTIQTRIMEIGGLEEEINISAPILIGGGSLIDGRTLLNDQIDNILKKHGAVLPLLENATISISAEGGANVSFVLKSDGDPTNTDNAFAVTDHDVSALTNGIVTDVLNPSSKNPTRVATFYDFRVTLGTFTYFIMEAKIQVKTKLETKYFIPGVDGNNTSPIPSSINSLNKSFGTMYPWIAVSGLEVSGSGKAAVLLNDQSGTDYYFTDPADSYNYESDSTLTKQQPGYTNTAAQAFKIEVWQAINPSTGVALNNPETYSGVAGTPPCWVNLFAKSGTTTPLFDLSKSLVTQNSVDINPGIMTSEFSFYCYVF